MIEMLRQFPAIWASLGLLVGGGVMFLVAQKYGPMKSEALGEVVGAYKEQIVANKGLMEMQKAHYEAEMADLKADRDDYRNKLHAEKEAHQSTVLQVADLQARPNVDKVYESQKIFFEKNTSTMEAIHRSIMEHDAHIEERTEKIIAPVLAACAEITKALNGHNFGKTGT